MPSWEGLGLIQGKFLPNKERDIFPIGKVPGQSFATALETEVVEFEGTICDKGTPVLSMIP